MKFQLSYMFVIVEPGLYQSLQKHAHAMNRDFLSCEK